MRTVVRRMFVAVASVAAVAALLLADVSAPAVAQDTEQMLPFPVAGAKDGDPAAVTLGVKFTVAKAGKVTAIEFHRFDTTNTGRDVQLWNAAGTRLAAARVVSATRLGWNRATFSAPVTVAEGQTFTASYQAPRGKYTARNQGFDAARAGGDLTAPVGAGVYRYGTSPGFPTQSFRNSDYYVTPVFVADGGAPPTTTTAPPPPPAACGDGQDNDGDTLVDYPADPGCASTADADEADAAPSGGGLDALPRVPWEGGPAYYQRFPAADAAGFDDPAFFPTGVWFESVTGSGDVTTDKAAGINTYMGLTANSNMAVIRDGGMKAVPQVYDGPPASSLGVETVGRGLADEADMIYGPGSDRWSGNQGWNTCVPVQDQGGQCGYTVQTTAGAQIAPGEGRFKYANYGKGVMFWETDDQAARFVNDFQDVVSNDIYWYTDPNVCGAGEGGQFGVTAGNCRRAANYGITMDEMRRFDGLDGKRQPVFAFIELGHPFTEGDAPTITGPQIEGAVVSSLIHEARGIEYFNHNFAGCLSQHVLRDSCGAAIRPNVTALNSKIKDLAPVLNTQSYAYTFNPALDTMLKKGPDGAVYVFSMLKRATAPGSQELTLPAGVAASSVQVLYENRSIPVVDGKFTDTLAAENSYHMYRLVP